MLLKCSECGGEVRKLGNTFRCTSCGRERKIEEKVIETIDMSDTAGLSVIME